jgi:chromosome segregation ATPase
MSPNDFEKLSAQIQQMEERILKNVDHSLNKSINDLKGDMKARFDTVDTKFKRIDERFDGVDKRLNNVEARLNVIDARLERVDERLDGIDLHLATLTFKFENANRRTNKHEALLGVVADQIQDHDISINELKTKWRQKHA